MEGVLFSVFVVFLAPHSIDTRPQIAKKKGDTEKLRGVAISSTCSQQLLRKKKTEAAQRFSLAFGEGRKRRKTLAWLLIRKAEEYQGLRGHTVRMYVCLSITTFLIWNKLLCILLQQIGEMETCSLKRTEAEKPFHMLFFFLPVLCSICSMCSVKPFWVSRRRGQQ